MGMFTRYNPKHRIYMAPIEAEDAVWGNKDLLFCDAKGVLSTGQVDQPVMETIDKALASFREEDKYCALVCLQVDEERSVTFAVEIDYEEALALDGTLTAVRDGKIVNGMVPEPFKKHPRRIIDKAIRTLRDAGLNPR